MSLKLPVAKKERQVEKDRDSVSNKSQGRIQIKHLTDLIAGSMGPQGGGSQVGGSQMWQETQFKKNGHSHTYTYLNDADSDKFSEIDSNYSMKNERASKGRHSNSPGKHRQVQHSSTSYGDDIHQHNPIRIKGKDERKREEKKRDN